MWTPPGGDIRRALGAEFGVSRRLGAVYGIPRKAGLAARLVPHLLRSQPGSPPRPGAKVGVWSGEEARFGQKRALTRVWARGSRPIAPKQTAYANLHGLAAVSPAAGRVESAVTQGLATAAVQVLRDRFAAPPPPPASTRCGCGTAPGYHSAPEGLRVPGNVAPVSLPPYSPELNPVGQAWD